MGIKVNQTNFTAGVLDPLLAAREDISFYYNGVNAADNLVVQPQGGVTRRAGMEHVQRLLHVLETVDLSGATVTAPEGGTAANLIDGDEATSLVTLNNLSTTTPFIVAHVDLGAAMQICAVDVIDMFLSSGVLEDEMQIQSSPDDSAWTIFGTAFNLDAVPRSRRVRGDVNARYWRLVRIGGTDVAATASVADIKFRAETSELSNGRLPPFSYRTEETYMMAASDQNMDVLIDTDRAGAISIPHVSSELPVVNWMQAFDTMILFHKDVKPYRLFRQGGDDEFDFRDVVFANIPQYDFGADVGGVNEVQTLNYGGSLSGGKITISLEGQRTVTISAINNTNIQAALRDLSNTSADGITVTPVTDGFEVTFGGDDGRQPWLEMNVDVLEGTSVWTVSRSTEGEYPGEDIMSEARGWPRCGARYQNRLWLGGLSGVPDIGLASVIGIRDASGAFDFDISRDDDAAGLLLRPDNDQSSAIFQIVAGRNLSFFTDGSEFYIPTEPIDKNAVLKLSTETGIKEGLRVFQVDGALIFVQGDGASIREFLFIDTEQSYQANNISVLSSHLIKSPVDAARRKAVTTDETDLLLFVNEDGTVAALATLRNQSVTAFTPFFTRAGDKILAAGVDQQKRVYFITERSVNGGTERYVEKFNPDYFLDGGGIYTVPTFETFTSTLDQSVFTWSFASPGSEDEIIVRYNGARLDPSVYAVDLGAKTVTIDTAEQAIAAGDIIRIAIGISEISGLNHLAGEDVQTYVDGSPDMTYTVSAGGVLTLNEYADISVQYGYFFDIYGDLMPVRLPDSQTLVEEKMRVYRLIFSLFETGALQYRANNGSWRDVPLASLDTSVLDKSMDDLLFTGTQDIQGIQGWGSGGRVEFRQTADRFGPLTIRSITREVAL